MVTSGRRSTAALADAGVLTTGTCFFGDPLDFTVLPSGQAGGQPAGPAAQPAGADAGGNGGLSADLRRSRQRHPASRAPGPSHRAKAVKHAYLDELAAFAQRGQSLVVYHHADRSATVDQQVRRGLTDLTRGVPVQPVAAVRACRGSNRLFLIGAASAAHSRYLTGRLTAFQHGPWVGELTVYSGPADIRCDGNRPRCGIQRHTEQLFLRALSTGRSTTDLRS